MIGREGSSQGTGYDPGPLTLDFVAKETSVPADGWDRVPPRWGGGGRVRCNPERDASSRAGSTCCMGGHVKCPCRSRGRLEHPRVAKDGGRSSVGRPIGSSGSKSRWMFGSRMAWTLLPILSLPSPLRVIQESGRSWPAESRAMIFGSPAEMAGRIISATWREERLICIVTMLRGEETGLVVHLHRRIKLVAGVDKFPRQELELGRRAMLAENV